MSVETPHYTYFTVTGRYLRRIVDGPDEDRLPDVVPSEGTFKFEPSVASFKDLSIPATFENVAQTGSLDSAGFIVDEQGRQGVTLMSGNSPHISPQGWTWKVTSQINGKQGPTFSLPANIAPGEVVDLTIVSPAATGNAGTIIIVSEASRVAAEAARDQALAAVNGLSEGLEAAIEAYLIENPPEAGGAVDSVNGKDGIIVLTATDVGAVPTTRTVAGKALSGNITLVKADVGLGSVDNTSDAAKPVSTATQTALDAKAPLASPTFTGTVSGVTKAHVGLGNVDNTTDAAKPVSTATQTALDAKVPTTRTVAGKALTADVTLAKADVGLGSVDNTADTAKPVSTAQAAALALKAPLASPTFTGTVSGVTASMVGLGSVNNTADTAKPVSTAQAAAIATKAPLNSVRVPVYATAANTWPTRASAIPSGFTGRVEWDHTLFGACTTPPSDMAAGDILSDIQPTP